MSLISCQHYSFLLETKELSGMREPILTYLEMQLPSLGFALFVFYGVSTLVDFLMAGPVHIYIYIYIYIYDL